MKTNTLPLETKNETDTVETALASMTTAFRSKMAALPADVKTANDNAVAATKRADALELKLNRPGAAANDNELDH